MWSSWSTIAAPMFLSAQMILNFWWLITEQRSLFSKSVVFGLEFLMNVCCSVAILAWKLIKAFLIGSFALVGFKLE